MVYLLFFLSGAAGLVYEIVWSRELGLLFGHTVHAAAVVLGAYFAGMALGYLLSARWAGRLRRPLAGYGLAELTVAIWAVATPHVLALFTRPTWAALLNHPEPEVQLGLRALLACLVLLPATTALGATLPFIAQHLAGAVAAGESRSQNAPAAARRTALAYACNTAGAVAGVLLATFVLILWWGVTTSGYAAAGLSAVCGLTALYLAYRHRPPAPQPPAVAPHAGQEASEGWTMAEWYLLAGLSGLGTLGLQVLYTRMFALTFHNSTYTFGGVVAAFLAALAVGSAWVARRGGRTPAREAIAWACLLGAPAIVLSVSLFQHFTRLGYFTASGGFAGYILAAQGLILLVVFVPTALLGAVLPYCFAGASQRGGIGRAVGRLTAINTLAAAVGALGTSFGLLPALGLWRSFALFAVLYLLAGLLLLFRLAPAPAAQRWRLRLALACAAGCLVVSGLVVAWPQSVVPKRTELLFERETPYGLINVLQGPDGQLWLRENNHYILGATVGADSEFRQGRLPLLLHPAPHEVAFLGLATGITASAALADPAVGQATAVELVPAVVEAARLFDAYNLAAADNPRLQLVINDARHFLYATPRQFDVIISDLFVPWHSQTGYLYTVEHYRTARARLKPDGLFCQWVPLYQVGAQELELIVNSFASVFPQTTLWRGEFGVDGSPLLALVGSAEPLKLDATQLATRMAALPAGPTGPDVQLSLPDGLLTLYVGGWPRPEPGQAWLNTDDHPRVEFLAPMTNRRGAALKGELLRQYYRRVLEGLPVSGIAYMPPAGEPAPDLTAGRSLQLQGK